MSQLAFPNNQGHGGIDTRTYIASIILGGMLVTNATDEGPRQTPDELAMQAILQADALINALKDFPP
jgi:hypothetical protein